MKTIEEAREYILDVKICTIFGGEKVALPSLWDTVDLPEKQPGESGWGEKVSAIWSWKNRLPAEYPDEIFYGKIKGGFAVLMDMDYLREEHFPAAYKPVSKLNALARAIFGKIEMEAWETGPLRNLLKEETGCSKSQFDTALKNLQISMNVVRSNHPDVENDTWLTFREVYTEIWQEHVPDA